MSRDEKLQPLVRTALQAARLEVARRLTTLNLPLSLTVPQIRVVRAENAGWKSDYENIQVGALYLDEVFYRIADRSVPNQLLGLKEQLQPLAEYLHKNTELAQRPTPGRSTRGVEGILASYLSPMARHYLQSLTDLAVDDQGMIDQLSGELEGLIHQDGFFHTSQLAVGGILLSAAYEHRGVRLRPLSPHERGAFIGQHMFSSRNPPTPGSNVVLPSPFTFTVPSALIMTTTKRSFQQQIDSSTLPNRVALAFFLAGFEISGLGVLSNYDEPVWAAFGISHSPFPVAERTITEEKEISQEEFAAVVDLAYKMPDFSGTEGSSREVVLYRVLRGCGMHWQESGFLDFAIALEAALLGSPTTELRYKFALYGALFLRHEFDPRQTFDRLKRIYDIRSKLVHGGQVKGQDLHAATQDAAQLAKAVTRKGVESGWPSAAKLDAVALDIGEPIAVSNRNRQTTV